MIIRSRTPVNGVPARIQGARGSGLNQQTCPSSLSTGVTTRNDGLGRAPLSMQPSWSPPKNPLEQRARCSRRPSAYPTTKGPPRPPAAPSASPRSKIGGGKPGDRNAARCRRKFSACRAIRTKDSRRSLAVLAQPHAGSAALPVDELDPSILKRPPQGGQDSPPGLRCPSLELAERNDADRGLPRQIILGPIEQGSGSAALGWRHRASISRCRFSSNIAVLENTNGLRSGHFQSGAEPASTHRAESQLGLQAFSIRVMYDGNQYGEIHDARRRSDAHAGERDAGAGRFETGFLRYRP